MADMKFSGIMIALLLTGLFAVALINGIILVENQNDASGSITDDPSLSSYQTGIDSALENATRDSNSATAVLSNSTITTSTSNPFVDSISGIWKTVKSTPMTVWNLTLGLALEKMLGDSKTIVLNILGAILSIIIIFAIIYLIATGDGR